MPVLTLPSTASSLTVRAKALVFDDPRSRTLLAQIEQVAPSNATILLSGETGTGKEIVARHVHQLSRRSQGPFVAVNCGAFSENLVESELFGHEKGSFTGAISSRAGWFEEARGGTLFLDEVGDLPLAVQVKLLRVLQENEVVRVGSRKSIPINVRLVAATNVDLHEAMAAGHFREDLYYRLNVVSVSLPPLRDRPGDIAPLARYFVEHYQKRLGIDPVELTGSAVERLLQHSWPGNIRELENSVHHALLVCRGGRITEDDLRLTLGTNSPRGQRWSDRPPSLVPVVAAPEEPLFETLERLLSRLFTTGEPRLHERIDQVLFSAAYKHAEQNQLQTARTLGLSRNIVRARLIQHGLLAGSLRGSSARPSGKPDPTMSPKFRIGYQKFGQLLLVKALGELDRELIGQGIELEWLEFPGGLQLVDRLQSGELDLGVVGECPPVFAQAEAAPIVYLAAEPSAPEAEAILVHGNSAISQVKDLKGRRIALNRGANVHYLLVRALEEAGVSPGELELTFLQPEDAERAFASGEVDAWAIWDPLMSSVRDRWGARVLRDGRGLTSNTAYYIAHRSFAEGRPQLVELVLRHVERAASIARTNPELMAERLALENGIQRESIATWLRYASGAVRMNPATVQAQQQVADRLFRLNLVARPVRVADAQWYGNKSTQSQSANL